MSEAISVEGLKKSYKGCCALSLAKARRSPARSPRITQPPPPHGIQYASRACTPPAATVRLLISS